jgi:hypothetical protein
VHPATAVRHRWRRGITLLPIGFAFFTTLVKEPRCRLWYFLIFFQRQHAPHRPLFGIVNRLLAMPWRGIPDFAQPRRRPPIIAAKLAAIGHLGPVT